MPALEYDSSGGPDQPYVAPRHPILGDDDLADYVRKLNILNSPGAGEYEYEAPTMPHAPTYAPEDIRSHLRQPKQQLQFSFMAQRYGSYESVARDAIFDLKQHHPDIIHSLITSPLGGSEVRQFMQAWMDKAVQEKVSADKQNAVDEVAKARQQLAAPQTAMFGSQQVTLPQSSELYQNQIAIPNMLSQSGKQFATEMGLIPDTLSKDVVDAVGWVWNHIEGAVPHFLDHLAAAVDAMKNASESYGQRFENIPKFHDFWNKTQGAEPGYLGRALADSIPDIPVPLLGKTVSLVHGSLAWKATALLGDFIPKAGLDPVVIIGNVLPAIDRAVELGMLADAAEEGPQLEGVLQGKDVFQRYTGSRSAIRAIDELANTDSSYKTMRLLKAMGGKVVDSSIIPLLRDAETSEEVTQVLKDAFFERKLAELPRLHALTGFAQRASAAEKPFMDWFTGAVRAKGVDVHSMDGLRQFVNEAKWLGFKGPHLEQWVDDFVRSEGEDKFFTFQSMQDTGRELSGISEADITARMAKWEAKASVFARPSWWGSKRMAMFDRWAKEENVYGQQLAKGTERVAAMEEFADQFRTIEEATRGVKPKAVPANDFLLQSQMRQREKLFGAVGDVINPEVRQSARAAEKALKAGGTAEEELKALYEAHGEADTIPTRKVNRPTGPEARMAEGQQNRQFTSMSMRDMMSDKALMMTGPKGSAMRFLDNFDRVTQTLYRPVKTIWIASPRLGLRIFSDELPALLGANRLGIRPYLMEVGESFLDRAALSPRPFWNAVSHYADKSMSAFAELPGFGGLKEMLGREVMAPPEIVRSGENWGQWMRNETDSMPDEMKRYLNKEVRLLKANSKTLGGVMDYHALESPLYRTGLYHTVNHMVMGDGLMREMIAADAGNVDAAISEFLSSKQGGDYMLNNWRPIAAHLKEDAGMTAQELRQNIFSAVNEQDVTPAWDALDPRVRTAVRDQVARMKSFVDSQAGPFKDVLRVEGSIGMDDIEHAIAKGTHPKLTIAPIIENMDLKGGPLGLMTRRLTDSMFGVVGHTIDGLVRDPIWRLAYNRAYERNMLGAAFSGIGEEEAARLANQEAVESMLPYIHDPSSRAPVDLWTQTISPFNFAFRQFVQRWGKTFVENPGVVRKASLFLNSGTTSGFFDTDEQGNTLFHMPVLPEVANWVAKHFGAPEHLFDRSFTYVLQRKQTGGGLNPFELFNKVVVPRGLPFSQHSIPGFGLMVSLPAEFLIGTKPNLQELRSFLVGPSTRVPGASVLDTIASQLAPGYWQSFTTALSGDDGNRLWGNAIKTSLMLAAEQGQDPNDPKVVKDVHNRARMLFFLNGLNKWISPYAPVPNAPGMDTLTELRKARDKYGIDEGDRVFLKAHPRGWAYTIPLTQAIDPETGEPVKGSIEASKEAMSFYADNKGFFKKYPQIAGFFAPHGAYDPDSFTEQIAGSDRKYSSINDWRLKYNVTMGNNFYYDEFMPRYQKAKEGIKSAEDKDAARISLGVKLEQVKRLIDQTYPGWRHYNANYSGREDDRKVDIDQISQAVKDPAVRNTPQGKAIGEFMAYWSMAQTRMQGHDWRADQAIPVRQWVIDRYHQVYNETGSYQLQRLYNLLFKPILADYSDTTQVAS